MHASIGHNKDNSMSVLRIERMAQEINSVMDRYLYWIAQLVRALARKAKGPDSSPGSG